MSENTVTIQTEEYMQLTGIQDPVTGGVMLRTDDIEEGYEEPIASMVIRLNKTEVAKLREWLIGIGGGK